MLAIQETKMQEAESLAISIKHWKNGAGKSISVQGASKGMLTWWDSSLFKFRSSIENRNWLFVELENVKNHENMWIGNIYGTTVNGAKEDFWKQL